MDIFIQSLFSVGNTDSDVATATLRDFNSPSYQSCFDSCVNEPQCNALDYTNQHCWLKTQGVDPPPKPMNSKTDDISVIFLP